MLLSCDPLIVMVLPPTVPLTVTCSAVEARSAYAPPLRAVMDADIATFPRTTNGGLVSEFEASSGDVAFIT